jgi:hypothetical protein
MAMITKTVTVKKSTKSEEELLSSAKAYVESAQASVGSSTQLNSFMFDANTGKLRLLFSQASMGVFGMDIGEYLLADPGYVDKVKKELLDVINALPKSDNPTLVQEIATLKQETENLKQEITALKEQLANFSSPTESVSEPIDTSAPDMPCVPYTF